MAIRMLLGILLIGFAVLGIYLGASFNSFLGMMLALTLLMGAGLLMTGVLRRCPINHALDRNTCQ